MEHGHGWDGEKPFELSLLCLWSAGLASFRGKQTGTHREGAQLVLVWLDSLSSFSEVLIPFACTKVAVGKITSQMKSGLCCCPNACNSPWPYLGGTWSR